MKKTLREKISKYLIESDAGSWTRAGRIMRLIREEQKRKCEQISKQIARMKEGK